MAPTAPGLQTQHRVCVEVGPGMSPGGRDRGPHGSGGVPPVPLVGLPGLTLSAHILPGCPLRLSPRLRPRSALPSLLPAPCSLGVCSHPAGSESTSATHQVTLTGHEAQVSQLKSGGHGGPSLEAVVVVLPGGECPLLGDSGAFRVITPSLVCSSPRDREGPSLPRHSPPTTAHWRTDTPLHQPHHPCHPVSTWAWRAHLPRCLLNICKQGTQAALT